jgi:hypothetical protein
LRNPETQENIDDAIEIFSEYFNLTEKKTSEIFEKYIKDVLERKNGDLLSNRLLYQYDGIDLTGTNYDDFGVGSLIFNKKLKPGTYEEINTSELKEAKQVGTIYHFTGVENLNKIIEDNKLMSSSKKQRDIKTGKKQVYSISFTRDKFFPYERDLKLGSRYLDARIVVDGNKLSNKYKIEPFNFFNKKTRYNYPLSRTEFEERITFSLDEENPDILNFDNYVISYDILVDLLLKSNIKNISKNIIDLIKKLSTNPKIKFFNKMTELTKEEAIELISKESLNENSTYNNIDYKQKVLDLTSFYKKMFPSITLFPKVIFKNDDIENAKNFFGKTGYYDPENMIIYVYTEGRHPKDIVKTFSHEFIHHIQNLEGRLRNINTTNVNNSKELEKIEEEAYLYGNIIFRKWENSLKE